MMNEEKVTKRQAIILIILSRLSISISTMPTIDIPPYNQDMWIVVILSAFYSTILVLPLLFLANRFVDYNLIGYMEVIYGKTLGKTLGIAYVLFFSFSSVIAAFNHVDLIGSTILTNSMNGLLIAGLGVTAIYTVSRGLIVRLRAVEIFGPVAISTIIILVILGIKESDFSSLFPILSDSTLSDIHSGALQLSFYSVDILLLAMIVPDLEDKKDINNIFFISIITSKLILVLAVIVTQAMLGLEQSRHTNFPFNLYVRMIKFPNILERIDVVFILTWLITSQARVNGFLYLAVRGLREILNKGLKEKRIVIIMGILFSVITFILTNRYPFNLIRSQLVKIHKPMFLIFIIIIPIITCIVYLFRRRSIDQGQRLLKNKGE
ncbi:hypothetical protein E9840_08115 [Tissierella creatinini]|nr:hypothetical protein E9840_08115 [Tissierella creatinini]TJX66671.1 hypothetical protein E8P77_07360 [Soehngenia saccharolytica]